MASIFLVVLSTTFVFAFGVSSPYWEGKPLTIYPGETQTVKITLQNMESEDVNVRSEIKAGNEIATLDQNDYTVKAGTKDTIVPIIVSIPENTPIGTTYKVILTSKTAIPGAEGGVSFGIGMDTTFDVEVVEKIVQPPVEEESRTLPQEKPGSDFRMVGIILVLASLAVAVVIYIVSKKKTK